MDPEKDRIEKAENRIIRVVSGTDANAVKTLTTRQCDGDIWRRKFQQLALNPQSA